LRPIYKYIVAGISGGGWYRVPLNFNTSTLSVIVENKSSLGLSRNEMILSQAFLGLSDNMLACSQFNTSDVKECFTA
jgi:hypothetical protein